MANGAAQRAERVIDGDLGPDLAAWVAAQLRAWGAPATRAPLWVGSARSHVHHRPDRCVVEYDPALRLVTVELWRGDKRVFGVDDFV